MLEIFFFPYYLTILDKEFLDLFKVRRRYVCLCIKSPKHSIEWFYLDDFFFPETGFLCVALPVLELTR